MNLKQIAVAGAMAGAALVAATPSEAGCVFNAKGKVIGVFGGATKNEFDRAGYASAKATDGGFSVGYSQSRGEMVFFDSDEKAASKANFNARFPDGKRQGWIEGCLKKQWPIVIQKSSVEAPESRPTKQPVDRPRETGNGNCVIKTCGFLITKHGLKFD